MTPEKRSRKTAAGLMAELESDPEWVSERDRKEQERARRAATLREAQGPLLADLRTAGLDATSVWDLVNTSTPYPRALPVLVEHLQRSYPDRVREGIARALAVSDARLAWPTLRRLYLEEPAGTGTKDGLAVALAATADEDHVQEVVDLLADARHGESRLLLLYALEHPEGETVDRVLRDLETDPALGYEPARSGTDVPGATSSAATEQGGGSRRAIAILASRTPVPSMSADDQDRRLQAVPLALLASWWEGSYGRTAD